MQQDLPALDDRDRAILDILQVDGRITNADLAERVHLSPSACLRRVKILEESALVAGTALILDQTAAGFPGTAYVFITLDAQQRAALEAFETRVKVIPEVQECYLLAGQHDYLLRIVFGDMADLERLHSEVLTRLPGVTRVQSTLTLRTVKRTTRIPV
ncbi:MAG: Lrp/AsnC family transcriptional regulator [Hyphomicrobiaceae bacterium]|nr:Lrp/AsnC family transcriptional regulator [Hyphomicrobiaceae bacterium]